MTHYTVKNSRKVITRTEHYDAALQTFKDEVGSDVSVETLKDTIDVFFTSGSTFKWGTVSITKSV